MAKNLGVPVGATIRPNDSNDNIAVAFSSEIKGGYKIVQTITERDAIMSSRREVGMIVRVLEPLSTYTLIDLTPNEDKEGYQDSMDDAESQEEIDEYLLYFESLNWERSMASSGALIFMGKYNGTKIYSSPLESLNNQPIPNHYDEDKTKRPQIGWFFRCSMLSLTFQGKVYQRDDLIVSDGVEYYKLTTSGKDKATLQGILDENGEADLTKIFKVKKTESGAELEVWNGVTVSGGVNGFKYKTDESLSYEDRSIVDYRYLVEGDHLQPNKESRETFPIGEYVYRPTVKIDDEFFALKQVMGDTGSSYFIQRSVDLVNFQIVPINIPSALDKWLVLTEINGNLILHGIKSTSPTGGGMAMGTDRYLLSQDKGLSWELKILPQSKYWRDSYKIENKLYLYGKGPFEGGLETPFVFLCSEDGENWTDLTSTSPGVDFNGSNFNNMLSAGYFIYMESNNKALYINIKTDPYKITEITKPTGENTNNLFYYGGFHYLIKNYGNIKVYRFADKYEDKVLLTLPTIDGKPIFSLSSSLGHIIATTLGVSNTKNTYVTTDLLNFTLIEEGVLTNTNLGYPVLNEDFNMVSSSNIPGITIIKLVKDKTFLNPVHKFKVNGTEVFPNADKELNIVIPEVEHFLTPETIFNLPQFEDDIEAVSLPNFTPYRTTTGEVRFKLPTTVPTGLWDFTEIWDFSNIWNI